MNPGLFSTIHPFYSRGGVSIATGVSHRIEDGIRSEEKELCVAKTKNRKTVFVLDDNEAFRQSAVGLLQLLDYDVEAFALREPVIKRFARLDESRASALLLDVRMPIMSGLDVHDKLNQLGIAIPVIYMTAHGVIPIAVAAMAKGAVSLLEKPLDEVALVRALGRAFSETVQLRRSVRANQDEFVKTRARLGTLTKRESQIVKGLLADMNNQELAREYNISIKTVELYRSNVMSKLEAKNAAHLIRMVMTCEPV